MKMPGATRALIALTLMVLLNACTSRPQYTIRKLPSGREVKLLGMMPIHFGNGSTALMLNYQTDLNISDISALKVEADEIWSEFRFDVERGNFNSGIISAHDEPKGLIIKNGHSYNFVYEKGPDGQWHSLSK